jgi:hypothetical protein
MKNYQGGEREMKKNTITLMFLVLLLGTTAMCFAAEAVIAIPVQSKVVDVRAEIPPLNALTVTITKYLDNGKIGYNGSALDFGTLSYDSAKNRFKAGCYYAVDAAVNSNSPTWSLTQAVQESVRLLNGKETLDHNINVSFYKWDRLVPNVSNVTMTNPLLGRFSLTDSNGKTYGPSILTGKALRIVYEVATGENDASGVLPITADKPVGQYKGQIKITLVQ